jgi:hypothetical protein
VDVNVRREVALAADGANGAWSEVALALATEGGGRPRPEPGDVAKAVWGCQQAR